MKEIKIIVPITPPSLNKQAHQWRGQYYQKKRLIKTWYVLILEAWGTEQRPQLKKARISLVITYRDRRRIKDVDNIIGAFKPIQDLLVEMDFIKADDPRHLIWGEVLQNIDKLSERTEIILTEMN